MRVEGRRDRLYSEADQRRPSSIGGAHSTHGRAATNFVRRARKPPREMKAPHRGRPARRGARQLLDNQPGLGGDMTIGNGNPRPKTAAGQTLTAAPLPATAGGEWTEAR